MFALLDPVTYALAAAAIVVAAAVQGSTGLGFGMVAAPVLAIVDPLFVPGPLLILALLVSLLLAMREHRAIDGRGLALALTGRIPASFLAALTLAALPTNAFAILFALLVLMAVGLSLAGWRLMPTRRNLLLAGIVSGYMGTLTSIGAPPMALVYQGRSGAEIRSTLAAYFVVGALLSIVALAVFGHFGWAEILVSLQLVPPLIVGFAISGYGRTLVDRGFAKTAVLSLSAASAAVLLVKQLV